jgi:membrane protease YdiL (CAAX protease family)
MMREKIKILVAADLIFLLLITASGLLFGIWSTALYLLSFVIPFAFAVAASKLRLSGGEFIYPLKNADIAMAGAFPTVITVMVISSATAALMGLFGRTSILELGGSLAVALVMHAILPAVLEEALFRYIPIRLLSGENSRVCIIVSAILFAFSHHSMFSIPYAFLAGVAFMTLDIISGSVLPSLVIHLLNNALSVLLMFYSDNTLLRWLLPALVALAACLSLIYLFIIRKRARAVISERFVTKEKYKFSYEILLVVIPSLIIAISELL